MKTDPDLIRLLEQLIANAWPAHIQQTFGQWRLRATFGVTKRANSVFAIGPIPNYPDWMERVEQFYEQHAIEPCYHVSDASPRELDRVLETRGYHKIFECSIMIAKCSGVIERVAHDPRFTIQFSPEADDNWITQLIDLEQYSKERHHAYSHIFSAIRCTKAFVRICENGEVVGIGTIVVEQGWAGLSNIVVAPNYRRKGIAVQLLRSLSVWALENGAEQFYLQVINENEAAVQLYHKLGFNVVSHLHYRIHPRR
jgi:ribosomal protein S18 acetylase RimI-like enzyme